MTKMFNSVEEMNDFLKGGKMISAMNFVSGMISLTISEDNSSKRSDPTCDLSVDKTVDKSLEDYAQDIKKSFMLEDGKHIRRSDMIGIIKYCAGLPNNVGDALVARFSKHSASISSFMAFDYLKRVRDGEDIF